jgi:LmbE family N-acetylglucosaminyl deacetylase
MVQHRALIFVPHPDDGEIFTGHLTQGLLARGWAVTQVIATGGEYGTTNIPFRGKRLRALRLRETEAVEAFYQTLCRNGASFRIHRLGYVDGHLPRTRGAVARFQRLVEDIRPDLAVGPDPFTGIDWHCDHIATGLIFYHALRRLPPAARPQVMLHFQSFRNNWRFPAQSFRVWREALSHHRSQITPLLVKLAPFIVRLTMVLAWLPARARIAEKYRRITLDPRETRATRLWHRGLLSILRRTEASYSTMHTPPMHELGLANPEDEV